MSAGASAVAPVYSKTNLPASITKTEEVDVDVYKGPLEDLIAAGLVRRDQLPEPGKPSISWSHGKRMMRNCRKDEEYLAVWIGRDITQVRIGVSPEARRTRREKQRLEWATAEREREARRKAEVDAQKAAERKEEAERAQKSLETILKTEDEFRRFLAKQVHRLLGIVFEGADQPTEWHAYRLDSEAIDPILSAVDGVVNAVMTVNVIFDAERHEQIINDYRATIRAADPAFEKQFAALTNIDASILEGEAQ